MFGQDDGYGIGGCMAGMGAAEDFPNYNSGTTEEPGGLLSAFGPDGPFGTFGLFGGSGGSAGGAIPNPFGSIFGGKTALVTASQLFLRSSPNENSASLGMFSHGTKVDVLEEGFAPTLKASRGWTKVRVGGKEGFMSAEWLQVGASSKADIPPPPAPSPSSPLAAPSASIVSPVAGGPSKLLLIGGVVVVAALGAAFFFGGK